MFKKKLIMGNWKMFGSDQHIQEWSLQFLSAETDHLSCEWVLFPPFPYLDRIRKLCPDKKIKLGAQNCAMYDEGAYTGEVSAKMLKDSGCTYVLVGHSERRQIYHETNEILHLKLETLKRAGLIPVFCIGETAEDRRLGMTFSILERQLDVLIASNLQDQVIAYEPVWAIGTGLTATPEEIQKVHAYIRNFCYKRQGHHCPIVYGGSVNPQTSEAILELPDVGGVLIGKASLNAKDFIQIGRMIKNQD